MYFLIWLTTDPGRYFIVVYSLWNGCTTDGRDTWYRAANFNVFGITSEFFVYVKMVKSEYQLVSDNTVLAVWCRISSNFTTNWTFRIKSFNNVRSRTNREQWSILYRDGSRLYLLYQEYYYNMRMTFSRFNKFRSWLSQVLKLILYNKYKVTLCKRLYMCSSWMKDFV